MISMLLSGWSLLAYHGLRTTEQDRAIGWKVYQLPSHPTTHMVVYLALGAALPFLSAWLIGPHEIRATGTLPLTAVLRHSYLFRLGFSIACSLFGAVMIAFLTMGYLDSR